MPENDSKNTKSKEHVRCLLEESFGNIISNNKPARLSHADCLSARSELSSFGPERLVFYLPQVLDDLLDTHTGKAGNSEDAEAVIQYLNVLVQGTDLDFVREHWGKEALEKTLSDESLLRQEALKDTANFTPNQAFAIWHWLELARTWPDLAWYEKDIDAAIQYWKSRSKDK